MFSLRLTVCACVLFLSSIDAAPKQDPYWNWNGIPPLRGAIPVIPPFRGAIPVIPPPGGDYPWQGSWNGSPLYNRGADFDSKGCRPGFKRDGKRNWCVDKGDKYCGHFPFSEGTICQ